MTAIEVVHTVEKVGGHWHWTVTRSNTRYPDRPCGWSPNSNNTGKS